MKLLITQSMLFPWIGMLEQISLADIIIHYDDVQYSKGSFTNRVQVKTEKGLKWMTVPVKREGMHSTIESVVVINEGNWKDKHMDLLTRSLVDSQYLDDTMDIVRTVYKYPHVTIASLSRSSMLLMADYYNLLENKKVIDSRDLSISGTGSRRVLDIVRKVGGTTYITGHGARNYLNHIEFERAGVKVEYMNYKHSKYPQRWGNFTPFVTSLDLIANTGTYERDLINPKTIGWREFLLQG